jgi:hypothetical protein
VATRQAYDASSGTVLTAANLDKHAGGWIGYVEVTAGQTGITSEADITSLTLTVTANASRYHKVSWQCEVDVSNLDTVPVVKVTDASNNAKGQTTMAFPIINVGHTFAGSVVETGWSGSTTRKLRAVRALGTGTVDINAAATSPAFLLIEDIGSA